MNQEVITKSEAITVDTQCVIIDRLKLLHFADSAIRNYSKKLHDDLSSYSFDDFETRFKEIAFKKKVEAINYRDIIKTGSEFISNELSDSIYVLNMSSFENWVSELLKVIVLNNKEDIFITGNKKERRKIDIEVIINSPDITRLWNYIIDNYVYELVYSKNIKDLLEIMLKEYGIDKSVTNNNILSQINELSLRRNVIVHNKKIIDIMYVKKAGEFSKYELGERVLLSPLSVFQQSDMFLGFMQNVRRSINQN